MAIIVFQFVIQLFLNFFTFNNYLQELKYLIFIKITKLLIVNKCYIYSQLIILLF